ncbi:MAG: hypothetical protein Q7T57_02585 [Dehalococcoidales bacterium]|nr:hypothetical protein [Dehalococcoidales bacterium]
MNKKIVIAGLLLALIGLLILSDCTSLPPETQSLNPGSYPAVEKSLESIENVSGYKTALVIKMIIGPGIKRAFVSVITKEGELLILKTRRDKSSAAEELATKLNVGDIIRFEERKSYNLDTTAVRKIEVVKKYYMTEDRHYP